MTDDWRPGDIDAESQATFAALYRILEDARRYEQYADVSQRAYDEELADIFRELSEEPRGRAKGQQSCSRSGWPTAGYTSH
jgi:hypothetical protein